jgi:hypothetical protein
MSGSIAQEEWNFLELLESADEKLVRLVRLYEYGREVAPVEWRRGFRLSLGQMAMLLKHAESQSPFFYFCVLLGDRIRVPAYLELDIDWRSVSWLEDPFFRLPENFREALLGAFEFHMVAMIDPHSEFHPIAILPILDGPPFKMPPVKRIELSIPIGFSRPFLEKCFGAYLHMHFPEGDQMMQEEGGKATIRQLKNDLRYLGALRLLRTKMTARKAMSYTKSVSGYPLYNNASAWSRAKAQATNLIESFDEELRPSKELLAAAPKNVRSVSIEHGTRELKFNDL